MDSDYKVGFIYDYGDYIDLDPFPRMPTGALYAHDTFLVSGALSALHSVGVDKLVVLSETGLIFLSEAIKRCDISSNFSLFSVPEIENRGGGNLLREALVNSLVGMSDSALVVPPNIITELDYRDFEEFHNSSNNVYASVVVVPGHDESGIEGMPPGYKLTKSMFVHKHLVKCGGTQKKLSLVELLRDAASRGKIKYYPFDEFYLEVNDEKSFLSVKGSKK